MTKQSPDCLSCFIYHFVSINVIMSFLWCIHDHVWYNKQSYYAISVLHDYPLAFLTQMNKNMLKKYAIHTKLFLKNKSVVIIKNTGFSYRYINDLTGLAKLISYIFLIFIHIYSKRNLVVEWISGIIIILLLGLYIFVTKLYGRPIHCSQWDII